MTAASLQKIREAEKAAYVATLQNAIIKAKFERVALDAQIAKDEKRLAQSSPPRPEFLNNRGLGPANFRKSTMTILKTQNDLVDASNADLVETYNALTGESVKRFSSAPVGRVRCANAMLAAKPAVVKTPARVAEEKALDNLKLAAKRTELAAKRTDLALTSGMTAIASAVTKPALSLVDPKAMLAEGHCPACGAGAASQTPAGAEGTVAGDERRLCHVCANEYWTSTGELFARRKPGRDASKAIAASWSDADTRAARSLKQKVKVDGVEHRSVKTAFTALNLPLVKHIKFRMELKAATKATFEHGGRKFRFEIA